MSKRSLGGLGLAMVLSGLLGCATHGVRSAVEPTAPVFALLSGLWGWSNRDSPCDENPFKVEYGEEQKQLIITYSDPVASDPGAVPEEFVYNLLSVERFSVRGQIAGETRLTEMGEPVVWDFVLLDRDTFCWRRTDWAEGSCTPPLVRCEPFSPPPGGPRLPASFSTFELVDSTHYLDEQLGRAYRYRSEEGPVLDMFVYPAPSSHKDRPVDRRAEAESATFLRELPMVYDSFEVVVNEPKEFDVGGRMVTGHVNVIVINLQGRAFVSFMHLVSSGDWYLKGRLTLPYDQWERSQAPNAAVDLFSALQLVDERRAN